jgi:2-dehydro-3-deoxygalactonokinase
MSPTDSPIGALIAIDWGTSRLRARLLAADGSTIAATDSDDGIGRLDGGHEQVFESICAPWPQVPAIMAGMVGSRQGWREAAYVPCPATIDGLAGEVTRFDTGRGRPITIVPGMMMRSGERRDVIRGEETQIAGLMEIEPGFEGLCIMPGTHSKWVRVRDNVVPEFQTFITGEMFELLSRQSFLRHSVAQEGGDIAQAPDFSMAVSQIVNGQPFAAALFSVRARQLLDNVSKEANRAFLSGLIIGGEIAAARATGQLDDGAEVRVVGGTSLASAYLKALTVAGHGAQTVNGNEAAFHGLKKIARALALLD